MKLSTTDLSVRFGPVQALRSVSIDHSGRGTAILGPNGAGKSTLLRAILGLAPASGGSVVAGDADVSGWKSWARVKHGIAYVPEGRKLFPKMSVADNLRLGGYNLRRSEVDEGIASTLESFPALRPMLKRNAGALSGGEQQMVAIGRAVMTRPKLILLDEPSLGLAPVIVRRLREIFLSLQDQGISLILVEQNAWLSAAVCDRGYLLDKGHVLRSGPADEVLGGDSAWSAYLEDPV
jgi:branched-chain amino acid transport system ATP-binding protein